MVKSNMKYLIYLFLLAFSFNIIGTTKSIASATHEQTCRDFIELLNDTTASKNK